MFSQLKPEGQNKWETGGKTVYLLMSFGNNTVVCNFKKLSFPLTPL